MNLIIGLHNVTSSQRLIDFARVVFSFDIKYLVITKVSGTAAQVGIPEVSKLAFKNNKSVIILPDLKDAVELLKPKETFLFSHNEGKELDKDIAIINNDKDSVYYLVFPGIESGFTKLEQSLGTVVKMPNLSSDIGPAATVSVFLYCYLQQRKGKI